MLTNDYSKSLFDLNFLFRFYTMESINCMFYDNLRIDKTDRDEITIREPQYVFAVNVCLMARRHNEIDDDVNCPTN